MHHQVTPNSPSIAISSSQSHSVKEIGARLFYPRGRGNIATTVQENKEYRVSYFSTYAKNSQIDAC